MFDRLSCLYIDFQPNYYFSDIILKDTNYAIVSPLKNKHFFCPIWLRNKKNASHFMLECLLCLHIIIIIISIIF